jgi:hypothetical protein
VRGALPCDLAPVGLAVVWKLHFSYTSRGRRTLGYFRVFRSCNLLLFVHKLLHWYVKGAKGTLFTKRHVYYPFCRRKWKRSPRITTDDRMNRHPIPELGGLEVRNVNRTALQDLLDRKAGSGLSFSLVGHLRWDLRHIFPVAAGEGAHRTEPSRTLVHAEVDSQSGGWGNLAS